MAAVPTAALRRTSRAHRGTPSERLPIVPSDTPTAATSRAKAISLAIVEKTLITYLQRDRKGHDKVRFEAAIYSIEGGQDDV